MSAVFSLLVGKNSGHSGVVDHRDTYSNKDERGQTMIESEKEQKVEMLIFGLLRAVHRI